MHLLQESDQLVAAVVRDSGRCQHSPPVEEDEVDVGLGQCRYVGQDLLGLALFAGHGEHPQVPGLDLAGELSEPGEADLDLLAEQRARQRAATVVGHVVDGVRVDVDGLGELHGEQVVGPAGR